MADSRSLSLVLCVWSIVRWDFKGTRLIYLIETEEGGANMIMQKSSRDTIVHLLQNRRRRVHEHCSSVDSLGIKIRVHHYLFSFLWTFFGHWKKPSLWAMPSIVKPKAKKTITMYVFLFLSSWLSLCRMEFTCLAVQAPSPPHPPLSPTDSRWRLSWGLWSRGSRSRLKWETSSQTPVTADQSRNTQPWLTVSIN